MRLIGFVQTQFWCGLIDGCWKWTGEGRLSERAVCRFDDRGPVIRGDNFEVGLNSSLCSNTTELALVNDGVFGDGFSYQVRLPAVGAYHDSGFLSVVGLLLRKLELPSLGPTCR